MIILQRTEEKDQIEPDEDWKLKYVIFYLQI